MTSKNPLPEDPDYPGRSNFGNTPLLSTSEVAAFLGVPIATLYSWRNKRYGPPGIRVGRYVKYRKADVDNWLRDQEDRAS